MANNAFMKKYEAGIDVVTAAKQRIVNAFANGIPVYLNLSGGKDSVCLNHLVYQLVMSGKVDKSLLDVVFIDEEGIYPCIERIVKNTRTQWLLAGVKFEWFAMQYKHFNCLNQLTQDESFICFDETKKDVWIRQPPSFAIRKHPLLKEGKDSYQEFLRKYTNDGMCLTGIRVSESVQRRRILSTSKNASRNLWHPIYDWTDSDVWKYIHDNRLDFPEAYLYMYQTGTARNKMRLSQFFSVDTVGSLVKMSQYYPSLFDRICRREPNAYMAMLYFDTELYRRKKKEKNKKEDYEAYKAHVLKTLTNIEGQPLSQHKTLKSLKTFLMCFTAYFDDRAWKKAYQICTGGDPKQRALRSLRMIILQNRYQVRLKNE